MRPPVRTARHALWSAIAIGGCAMLAAGAPACRGRAAPRPKPTLAVLVTVDQLRADLLERYDSVFGGGFRRLRDRGLRFDRAMVDHAITVSHPGHVSLATGLVPSRHGIVDAAFYEGPEGDRRFVDALHDPDERILGAQRLPGVSPRRILAGGLPEWFLAADPEARFAAVGSGAFSSLLHAGRTRGDVYWYMAEAGGYVTSTYYRDRYPDWVTRFNDVSLPRFMRRASVWDSSVPPERRGLALPDRLPYEAGGRHNTFPHLMRDEEPGAGDDERRALARWLAATPLLDAATLGLAREAVTALDLGRRGATDFLSIVVSQADGIGHRYGPLSQEQLDTLLRLDAELGEFFHFLDQRVGERGWVVALSADHGTADIPEHRVETGRPGRRLREAEIEALLAEARDALALAAALPHAERAERLTRVIEAADFVADAMTPADLARSGEGDPFVALYRNSWRADRVPRFPLFSFATGRSPIGEAGVAVRLREGVMVDLDPAVHGSPYLYDRHVPILFMGPGIARGASSQPARTVDVAPSLAALAGVPAPGGLDGRSIVR